MAEQDIINAFNQGLSTVVDLVTGLTDKITEMEERLEKLENQNKKTSKNSNKPPSTDGFKKTQSLRKPSGAKPGGQAGHKGSTLLISENPEEIIVHDVLECRGCGISLDGVEATKTVKRQVVDIPQIKTKITEHQVLVKTCTKCGTKTKPHSQKA